MTPDGKFEWLPDEEYVDYRDPVVKADNKDFLRADLILFDENFAQAILVEN